jgi:hypothetical protein
MAVIDIIKEIDTDARFERKEEPGYYAFYQPTWAYKLIEWKKLRPGQGTRELVSAEYPTFKEEAED